MSKLTLKKELKNLSAEQLSEIILDCYSARKEFTEYFEFFLNPDVQKLTDKYTEKLKKEILRARRRGYCSARISHVKKMIKEYSSFNPGATHVIDLMFETIALLVMAEKLYYFTETLNKGTLKLVEAVIEYADKHFEFEYAVRRMDIFLANAKGSSYYMKRVKSTFENSISSLS